MEDSIFATVLLPIALAVIMLSLGMSLRVGDFLRILDYPRAVVIGLFNFTLVSPLLAFLIGEVFSLDPVLAVGLVLLGASPGGTLANLLTHLARGDTALSITITAISSLAAVITVPLFLTLATRHFGATELDRSVGMLGIVARVLLVTVLPLAVGMWLRARRPGRVAEIESAVRAGAVAAFLLAVIGVIAAEQDRVLDNIDNVAAAAVTLNASAMAFAYATARLARLGTPQATAIAMELGIHNSALAIAVGATITTELTVPAAVYATFMFLTAGIFARLMRSRNAEAAS